MSTTARVRPLGAGQSGAGLDPFDLAAGFVLESGQTWGEVALDFQRDDAAAILSETGPRRHNLLRGRGMSKTTDVAAISLALLLTRAPRRSKSYVYAVDAEQAELTMDALSGIVARTPGLSGAVAVAARSVTVLTTGASLTIETSDGASSFGSLPWLTVVDELGVWPSSTNHRRLWSAIVSAVPKVPGARLLVIGTAGSPIGVGAKVWAEAVKSVHWRASKNPGPSPWWSEADVEATEGALTPSEYRRLILCEFAEGDDALTSVEDVEAAIRPGDAVLEPRRGVEYVAALDVGTRRDLTALVVGHTERHDEGRVTVVDRVLYWRPAEGDGGRVDLTEVEASVLRVCKAYGARLRFDRMQAEQMTANLTRAGVKTEEFIFSAAGTNRLARGLFVALRDRALSLPDDDEVREEFVATRLVETGPGTVKLQNPPGSHDDLVVATAMVVADLNAQPEISAGGLTVPRGPVPERGQSVSRAAMGAEAGRASALRAMARQARAERAAAARAVADPAPPPAPRFRVGSVGWAVARYGRGVGRRRW